jgi:hypothetical protein
LHPGVNFKKKRKKEIGKENMTGLGLEPETSGLTDQCSIQPIAQPKQSTSLRRDGVPFFCLIGGNEKTMKYVSNFTSVRHEVL